MLSPLVSAALVLALAVAGCRAPSPRSERQTPPPVAWPQVPCRRQVEAFLAVGGLTLADLADVRVREDRLAGGQPGEQVGHWHISGRPPQCATGRLEMIILPDCAIDDWSTAGGCRLPGLEPVP